MIRARTSPSAASFVARLARKAQLAGKAQAEMRVRAARGNPARWRMARLLWPLFGDR
ncbi:hypothetical protein [Tsuneonella sp. SYSU-LHT278]|uniref:hypothetical protein n=1 Tax=Tsuneonella sediminis TaxID=3416089 RepID=UPI003F7A8AC7